MWVSWRMLRRLLHVRRRSCHKRCTNSLLCYKANFQHYSIASCHFSATGNVEPGISWKSKQHCFNWAMVEALHSGVSPFSGANNLPTAAQVRAANSEYLRAGVVLGKWFSKQTLLFKNTSVRKRESTTCNLVLFPLRTNWPYFLVSELLMNTNNQFYSKTWVQ